MNQPAPKLTTSAPRIVAIAQPANLGDVMACLPMARQIKAHDTNTQVILIGRTYTRPLVNCCADIDRFVDVDDVLAHPELLAEMGVTAFINPYLVEALGKAASTAGVAQRVGNLRRPRTLAWANRFIFQGSKNVPEHMANLNLRHLRPLGILAHLSSADLAGAVRLHRIPQLRGEFADLLDPARFNVILHPKSNKNGREWPAAHWLALLRLLPADQFRVFITGQPAERKALLYECPEIEDQLGDGNGTGSGTAVDLMGQLDLAQLMALMRQCDGLVAAGTGPLHIAAALGIHTLGLFPGRDRSNATRWQPMGPKAEAMSHRTHCAPAPDRCPIDYKGEACSCMIGIQPQAVLDWLLARAALPRIR